MGKVADASLALGAATANASRVVAEVAGRARAVDRLPTSLLLGMIGAGAASFAGYALTLVTSASFATVLPLSLLIGLPGGLLFGRKVSRDPFEQQREATRISLEQNEQLYQILRERIQGPGITRAVKADAEAGMIALNQELRRLPRTPLIAPPGKPPGRIRSGSQAPEAGEPIMTRRRNKYRGVEVRPPCGPKGHAASAAPGACLPHPVRTRHSADFRQ